MKDKSRQGKDQARGKGRQQGDRTRETREVGDPMRRGETRDREPQEPMDRGGRDMVSEDMGDDLS